MARKREPISSRLGAGTDALFSGPAGEPPAPSQGGDQVAPNDPLEADRETSVPGDQVGGKPVSQEASTPATLVKATFYLTPELVMKLEEIRMARLRKGQRIDKSALVREAIERLAD